MAQRRMISKSISTSRKLAKLSDFEALLFTWLIPHCDDFGRMDAMPQLVKGIVIPLRIEDAETVGKALFSLENAGLIIRYKVNDEEYLQITKWEDHQTFKTDRKKVAKYPSIPTGNQPEPLSAQVKLSEDKISEVKLGGALAPKAQTEMFFKSVEAKDVNFELFVKQLSEKNKTTPQAVAKEIQNFCDYWTELNHTGTKQKWQQQPTFEVRRRLATWFGRAGFKSFSTQAEKKGRNIIT